MKDIRNKIAKMLTVISIIAINILVIILMILWTNYVKEYKQNNSDTIISIIRLSIANSDNKDDIDETCSAIMNYVNEIPNRTIVVYDDKFNLYNVYSNKENKGNNESLNVKDYPGLFNSLNSSDSGSKSITVGDHNQEVFWNWVTTKDGSRKLLIVYGIELASLNEFSFVFIISYLLIIFILMLSASIYISRRNDYLTSLVKLYRLSSTCYDR